MTATWTGRAWSCSVRLVVTDETAIVAATRDLVGLLARVDIAASRFRGDSELTRANERAGRPTAVGPLLADLVAAALDAAARTDGAVDPTVGLDMQRIGYDRDFAQLTDTLPSPVPDFLPARGRWREVELRRGAGLLTVPVGTALDLGATAKAATADRAARMLAERYRTGVLVELGGDIAVAGTNPGGWIVRVGEREDGYAQRVRVPRGGLTTSTTVVRHWVQDGVARHHIVDPSTGAPAGGPWRTASVHASSALVANTASTAAIVLGPAAEQWLRDQRLSARLVGVDGSIVTTPGWPEPARTLRPGPTDVCRPQHSVRVSA